MSKDTKQKPSFTIIRGGSNIKATPVYTAIASRILTAAGVEKLESRVAVHNKESLDKARMRVAHD